MFGLAVIANMRAKSAAKRMPVTKHAVRSMVFDRIVVTGYISAKRKAAPDSLQYGLGVFFYCSR